MAVDRIKHRHNSYLNCTLVSRYAIGRIKKEYDITKTELDILIIIKKLEGEGFSPCSLSDLLVFTCGNLTRSCHPLFKRLLKRGYIVNEGKQRKYELRLSELSNEIIERYLGLCADTMKNFLDAFLVRKGKILNKRQRLKVKRAALYPPSEDTPL